MSNTLAENEDSEADAPLTPLSEDMQKRTSQYIQIRDALKRLDEKQAAERKPLLDVQERLTGIIRSFMDTNKLDTLKTKAGTCYTSTRYSASVADAEAFMNFVREKGLWDLIERRANATAVKDYVAEHHQLPAGVNLTGLQTLGVRRPSGKSK